MAKANNVYCTQCGNETLRWQGQCPACGSWNTIVEQPAQGKGGAGKRSGFGYAGTGAKAQRLKEIETTDELRFRLE